MDQAGSDSVTSCCPTCLPKAAILLPCGNGTHQLSQDLDLTKTTSGECCLKHMPPLSKPKALWAPVLLPALSQQGLEISLQASPGLRC